MSSQVKQAIKHFLAFTLIVTAPVLLVLYYRTRNLDDFYERLRVDNEICYQRAREDGVDTRWCNEIERTAKLAYRESSAASNFPLLVMFLAPILFVLVTALGNLRRQVEELKEKIDA